MKKNLLPLLIMLPCWSAFGQVANGGFEDWTKEILFEHPVTGTLTASSNYETFFEDGSINVT